MTRNSLVIKIFTLALAGAILFVSPILAQTGSPPSGPAKGPAASDANISAKESSGAGTIGSFLSQLLLTSRTVRPTPPAEESRSEGPARIWLRVPRDAQVWFNGQETKLTGRHRRFFSPSLVPGKTYTYRIRVRWMKDGKAVVDERKIEFRAGESVPIDFTQPDDRPPVLASRNEAGLSSR